MKLINLGSGPDGVFGWINYDWGVLPILSQMPFGLVIAVKFGILNKSYLRKWPKLKLWDLRWGIPLSNETVDWVYSSHFLEHLKKQEAEKLLNEIRRVLKRTGKLRLLLPDLNKIIIKYTQSGKAVDFCREFYGFDKDIIAGWGVRGHEWMYDEKSAIKMLEDNGFKNIKVTKFRVSKMPDVKKLDLPVHRELGMYLEAEKGQ